MAAWAGDLTREEAAATLLDAGVPCAPVRSVEEVMRDPHLEARGMVREIEHPEFGTIRVPGLPLRLHGTEALAPGPGGDGEAVLAKLGLTEDDVV